MPPSRPICETLNAAFKIKGEIVDKFRDLWDIITKLVTLSSKLKFGAIDIELKIPEALANIAGNIAGEILATITSISSRVAENILGPLSRLGTNIFEIIFSHVLKILLAFPTAVFSFVAIPHDMAIKATRKEAIYLKRAESDLSMALRLILKWIKGKSGKDYKRQMLNALPFIINAINQCSDMIYGLKGEPVKPGEFGNNSVFKKNVFNHLKGNLKQAINLSRPQSTLNQRLQITQRIEKEKASIFQEKMVEINSKYNEDKKELSKWYQSEMLKISPGSSESIKTRLKDSLKEYKLRLEYQQRLEIIDFLKQEKIEAANIQAQEEALANKQIWEKALLETGEIFIADMQVLEESLYNLLENMKNAYSWNKLSQLYCNNAHDIRNIITFLIKEIIAYIRDFGNATGPELATVFEGAQSLMEVAKDKYEDGTNPGADFTAFELSKLLSMGHASLVAADVTINSSVSDSLIDLINSDDVLASENEEFDEFIQKLERIPDWDGRVGVWAVSMTDSAINPYIKLIADITEMLAKVPILALRNREKDENRINSLFRGVGDKFRVLSRHNSAVANVLSSYTPYYGNEAGDLIKILSSAGLLENFASALSVASLVGDMIANYSLHFGTELPTVSNCKSAYSDLFKDEKTRKGLVSSKKNQVDARLTQNNAQAKFENKELDRINNQEENRSTNYDDLDDKKSTDGNLLGNSEQ